MTSLFLNPYTMLAGAALISSPIIIHLLNRMRYRRIRWAAMEFLLKAQERNRRRRIIEQIILLALRIGLVLLIGLLLARFISDALAFVQPQNTQHVVVLDDTASMGDAWRDEGEMKRTYEIAGTAIVADIARGAALARTPQSLTIVRLSDPDAPDRIDRITAESIEDLRQRLADFRPTALHVSPLVGIRKARELFEQSPGSKRVLHVVSDFRHRDWAGSAAATIAAEIEPLTQPAGAAHTAVHLLDVADPTRSPTQNEVRAHDNVGLIDLQPVSRLAARYMPVEFTLTVGNFSPAGRRNVRVTVRVNGQRRDDASFTILDLKPGVNHATFTASFDQLGQNAISAAIEAEESGLAIDNVRYATIEVREKVPLLFILGDIANRGKADSDAFYLRALFVDAARGFEVIERSASELEQANLDQYPSIFLLNVPRLNDKALANLEAFVRAGGGLFIAVGDAVDAPFYNQRLYADGRGLLPCPLDDKPSPRLTDAQRLERLLDPAMPAKVFPRGDAHPILARLYRDDRNRESNTYLRFLSVDQHYPVPRARWNLPPGSVDEILTLPNMRSIEDYTESVQQLLNQIPVDAEKYAAFRSSLREHQRRIKTVLANGRYLHQLAGAIESLLNDPGEAGNPDRPDLREFWQQPALAELAERFSRLLESVRYGDPLMVARRFGRGPVVAYLTTAGSAWNDFPNGPARPYFVMLMLEVQRYLAGAGAEVNRLVGVPMELPVDPNRFGGKMRRFFMPEPSEGGDAKPANVQDLGEQSATLVDGAARFVFADNRRPGIYRFEMTAAADGNRVEQVTAAFNVDTLAEGDLRRASRDELLAAAPGAQLHTPGSGLAERLSERRSDLSESPWLYLILLLVLVAEQAMAVHLSYHATANPALAAVRAGARATS